MPPDNLVAHMTLFLLSCFLSRDHEVKRGLTAYDGKGGRTPSYLRGGDGGSRNSVAIVASVLGR